MDDKFDRDINPNFIEVYDGLYSKEFCDKLIKLIDKQEELGLTRTRKGYEGSADATKSDTFMFLNRPPEMLEEEVEESFGMDYEKFFEEHQVCHWAPNYERVFNQIFWDKAYPDYSQKYSILNTVNEHNSPEIKLQKTRPTEGYHVWHCEQSSLMFGKRLAVWMLYLNDEFEAGETEFLYQSKRIKPKTGRLVIWPAGYTHTHRGNPPIGGTKYAATGWIEYTDNDK